jgi:4-amino-4-deoxy-L-arabinose transferase-like glycosyltransferase
LLKDHFKSNKYLISILLICFIFRLLFFLAVKPWDTETTSKLLDKDALEYNQLATTIIHHHHFADQDNGPPNSFRTPGYPIYLAFIYFIFGEIPWIILFSQIFIDTLSCYFLYLLFYRIFSLKIALFAALFYALDPFLILHSTTLLSDILFVFFIIIGSYFFSFLFKSEERKIKINIFVASGFSFGLATLVRPIALYIPILLVLFILFSCRKKISLAVKYSVILSLTFIMTILPWSMRNYFVFNNFSLSSAGSLALIEMYIPPMEMERRGQSYEEVNSALLFEADSLIKHDGLNPENMNNFQKSKYWKSVALKYIFKYPLPFVRHYALGSIHYFVNLGTTSYSIMLNLNSGRTKEFDIKAHPNLIELVIIWFQQKSLIEIIIGLIISVFLLISYVSVLIGLIVSWKNYNKAFLIFCISMILYFVILTGPQGLERYKLPSIPFYLAFAGIGLDYFIARVKMKKNK